MTVVQVTAMASMTPEITRNMIDVLVPGPVAYKNGGLQTQAFAEKHVCVPQPGLAWDTERAEALLGLAQLDASQAVMQR